MRHRHILSTQLILAALANGRSNAGNTTNMMIRNTASGMSSARRAPVAEPTKAHMVQKSANFQWIYPLRAKRQVANVVPIPELSLLVPMA